MDWLIDRSLSRYSCGTVVIYGPFYLFFLRSAKKIKRTIKGYGSVASQGNEVYFLSMADAIGQLSSHPSILDPSQICQQSNSYSSHCKDCYILLCLTAHYWICYRHFNKKMTGLS